MARAARLLRACFIAALLPAAAAVPNIEELDEFGKAAAMAMDSVGRFDEEVALDWWRPGRKSPFMFLGDVAPPMVTCELSQSFHIVANANEQANFNLGACERDAKRVAELAASSAAELKRMLDQLFGGGKDKSEDRLKMERMLTYRKVALPGSMTGHTFTIMIMGHGFVFVNTAAVHDPARGVAFVVQADVSALCGRRAPLGTAPISPAFCQDTNKALLDVARDLARRYAKPKAR